MFQIKYRREIQFLLCFIAHLSHLVNPIDFCWKPHCLLAGKQKGGMFRFVCIILSSSPTVEMEMVLFVLCLCRLVILVSSSNSNGIVISLSTWSTSGPWGCSDGKHVLNQCSDLMFWSDVLIWWPCSVCPGWSPRCVWMVKLHLSSDVFNVCVRVRIRLPWNL